MTQGCVSYSLYLGMACHQVRRSQNSSLWSEARNLLVLMTWASKIVLIFHAESLGCWLAECLLQRLEVSVLFESDLGLGPWWLCYLWFLNAPESWHDSRIAQDLYLKLLDLSQGRLLCDSAFRKHGQLGSRLLSHCHKWEKTLFIVWRGPNLGMLLFRMKKSQETLLVTRKEIHKSTLNFFQFFETILKKSRDEGDLCWGRIHDCEREFIRAFSETWSRSMRIVFSSRDVLGWTLAWFNSSCKQYYLCCMFWMTQGTLLVLAHGSFWQLPEAQSRQRRSPNLDVLF